MKYQDSYEHVFAYYCKALLAMLIALFWSAAQTLLTSPFYSVAFLAAYYVGLASAAATVICSIIILEDFKLIKLSKNKILHEEKVLNAREKRKRECIYSIRQDLHDIKNIMHASAHGSISNSDQTGS